MELQYTASAQETANATFDFLTNRPVIVALLSFMKMSCFFLCVGFAINTYQNTLRKEDLTVLGLALGWIFFYKKINRAIIKLNLKQNKFTNVDYKLKIDERNIYWQYGTNKQQIAWNKLRYILKNQDGYIIPLTGISNAGKFIWLPAHSLQTANIEDDFIAIANKFKLKIKKI